jgi:hypothetical protein
MIAGRRNLLFELGPMGNMDNFLQLQMTYTICKPVTKEKNMGSQ